MDRNYIIKITETAPRVALRKESVDRNDIRIAAIDSISKSLSARRAWIEITAHTAKKTSIASLSARRAWIEIIHTARKGSDNESLSARRAWIEIVEIT